MTAHYRLSPETAEAVRAQHDIARAALGTDNEAAGKAMQRAYATRLRDAADNAAFDAQQLSGGMFCEEKSSEAWLDVRAAITKMEYALADLKRWAGED